MPSCNLEQSDSLPEYISPFTHIKLFSQIAKDLDETFRSDGDAAHDLALQDKIEKWMKEFPPILSYTATVTSLDETRPHIAIQRHQLHALAFMTCLDSLRPYVTKAMDRNVISKEETHLRALGVDCCLRLVDSTEKLFKKIFPIGARYFLVIWCFFDAAVVLCSVILHEDYQLPQLHDLLEAIGTAIGRLQELSPFSRAAAVSHDILVRLAGAIPTFVDKMCPVDDGDF